MRPAFLTGDRVVIRWIFHFEWLDGTVTDVDEIAYQRWEGDRIAEEKFFMIQRSGYRNGRRRDPVRHRMTSQNFKLIYCPNRVWRGERHRTVSGTFRTQAAVFVVDLAAER